MFEFIGSLLAFFAVYHVIRWFVNLFKGRPPQVHHSPASQDIRHVRATARPATGSQVRAPRPSAREGYGPHWKDLSRMVRERDGWVCYLCGWQAVGRNRYFLHTHHIVPRGRGGTDTPDNLISLCLECHAEQPGHQRMRYSPDYQRFMDMRYG